MGRGGAEADVGAIARLLLVAHMSAPGQLSRKLSSPHWLAGALLLAPSYVVHITRLLAAATCSALASAARFAPLNVNLRARSPRQVSMSELELLLGLGALRAIQRPLFDSAASLDRQLAALRLQCGEHHDDSGAESHLPTKAQLQAAWAVLAIEQASAVRCAGHPPAELASFGEQAARALLDLQPDNPRSSYLLGQALFLSATTSPSFSLSRLRAPASMPHFRRSAELARAQGSDFWLAM